MISFRSVHHSTLCSIFALGVVLVITALPVTAQQTAATQKPHPSLPDPVIPNGLGVNIHFTDPRAGEMKMLAEGGFTWIRMDLTWSGTEREKGKYDFSAYDRLLKALDAHKIRALFILDYGNGLYSPGSAGHPFTEAAGTAQFRAAYARWAVAAVQHFKGRGILWEIWNEPNHGGFWKPKPNVADYAALAREASLAIRAVAPQEAIIGPATSTIDLPFLEGCFKAGLLQYWDAVSVHPYRQSGPETSNDEYRQLRLLIEKYKPKNRNIPILSGEWGYSAAWSNYDEAQQGKMLPRQWMINLLNNVPVSIWYDWHNDGTDPKEAEHNFGTVDNKYFAGRDPVYDAKPAYRAAQTFVNTLRGFRFNKRLWTGRDDEWVMLFNKGDEVRLAVWTTDSKAPRSLSLAASSGTFRVVGHTGEVLSPLTAANEQLKIEVNDGPKYLLPQKTNSLLVTAARWERAPLELVVKAPTTIHSEPLEGIGSFLGPVDNTPHLYILRDSGVRHLIYQYPKGILPTQGAAQPLFKQQTKVVVANPLRISIWPRGKTTLPVHVENPSGEPLQAYMRIWWNGNADTVQVQSLTLAQGETAKTLVFNIPPQPDFHVVYVQITENAEPKRGSLILLAHSYGGRFTWVDDFTRPKAGDDYAAVGDGDAKVLSTQKADVVDAPEPAPNGDTKVLRLDYSWEAGWKFVQVLLPNERAEIKGQPKAVQMYVYGDGSGNLARLRVMDATGQTFQPTGGPIDWKGWKLMTFPLDGRDAGHWGGANDGVLHYPLRWSTPFLLDSAKREKQSGTIYITAPVLVD
jgi:hypothetical protein